jgi:hypothetical protein
MGQQVRRRVRDFIFVPVDAGTHGPGDDRVEVVRSLVQLFGSCTGRQLDRVQPGRWHRILGDLDTARAGPVGKNRRERNAKS